MALHRRCIGGVSAFRTRFGTDAVESATSLAGHLPSWLATSSFPGWPPPSLAPGVSARHRDMRETRAPARVSNAREEDGRKIEEGSMKQEAGSRKQEAGSRKQEEGRRKKEAGRGRGKQEGGRRKKEEGRRKSCAALNAYEPVFQFERMPNIVLASSYTTYEEPVPGIVAIHAGPSPLYRPLTPSARAMPKIPSIMFRYRCGRPERP